MVLQYCGCYFDPNWKSQPPQILERVENASEKRGKRVGYECIEETEDPERALDRAMKAYLKKGYSKEWGNQRLKSIEVRKALTDEWEDRGIKKGRDFAILTDQITHGRSVLNPREYKQVEVLC